MMKKSCQKIEGIQQSEPDWWDIISNEERLEIEEGITEYERGDTKTHDEIMNKYK